MSVRSSAQVVPSDTGAGYFSNLPRYALPALQAAFDRIKTGQFKSQAMHTSFKRDLLEVGVEAPSFAVLNQWMDGVLHGRIERPVGSNGPAVAAIELANQPSPLEGGKTPTKSTTEPAPFSVLTPADWRRALKAEPNALGDLVALAIDEKTAALQADARRYARLLISEQLREIADELEAAPNG